MAANNRTEVGNTEVVTAGTPVQLVPANSEHGVAKIIQIQADPSNTGTLIAVGGVGSHPVAKKELGKTKGAVTEKNGPIVILTGKDPSQIYIDAEKNGDCVTWLIEWL